MHDSIRNMSRSSYEAEKKRVIPIFIKPECEIKETIIEAPVVRHHDDENTWIKAKEDGAEVYINASTKQRVTVI